MKWTPAWGDERIHDMIEERPDWCVSRQRFWGVPLIIFYCDACGKQLDDFTALRARAAVVREEGADAWFTHSAEELLPAGTKCPLRRRELAQGNTTFWTCGSIPAPRISRCLQRTGRHVARGCVSGRPRPVSRMVPQFAAGWRGRARQRALSAGGDARLDAG